MSGIGDLWILLAADGSQIEIRELAEISGDELLIKQFQEHALDRHNKLKDIHNQVGHTLTGWPIERIANDEATRRSVKGLHFGIVYGLSEENVYETVVAQIRKRDGPDADLTGITKPRMIKLHRAYFIKYPGVKRYMERYRRFAEEHGYVETLFGFRSEIKADDERGTYWGNQAINRPVQGTAHQFLLIALALLDLKPRTYSLLRRCIMEVHDALYFLVRLRDLPEAYKQLMHLFEVGAYEYAQRQFKVKLRVPLLAEGAAGFTLGSMVKGYEGEPVEEFIDKWRDKYKKVAAQKWEDLMPASIAS